jgi:predicted heme/steroid binding protein
MQPETQPGNAAGTGNQRAFTVEELSRYNGSNGNPAYVAVNGIVYDVSNVMRWAGGSHFGLMAGQDHTSDFMDCHGGMTERLQSLPVVGTLVTS